VEISDLTEFVSTTQVCPEGAYCSADGGSCPKYAACADLGDGKCLMDCDANDFLNDQGECVECNTDCPNGCLREENCELCSDLECATCDGFNAECIECIEFASKTGNNGTDCECDPGYVYNIEQHICEPACHESCEECSDVTRPRNCDICKVGWYSIPDS
jgi:hypothetical protein